MSACRSPEGVHSRAGVYVSRYRPSAQQLGAAGDERAAGLHGERRRHRGGGRLAAEEVHEDAVSGHDVLVDQDGDRAAVAQRAQDLGERAVLVDDDVAPHRPHLAQPAVEIRVVERARDHVDRPEEEPVPDPVQLPVPEVRPHQHRALSRRHRALDVFAPADLDQRADLVGTPRSAARGCRAAPRRSARTRRAPCAARGSRPRPERPGAGCPRRSARWRRSRSPRIRPSVRPSASVARRGRRRTMRAHHVRRARLQAPAIHQTLLRGRGQQPLAEPRLVGDLGRDAQDQHPGRPLAVGQADGVLRGREDRLGPEGLRVRRHRPHLARAKAVVVGEGAMPDDLQPVRHGVLREARRPRDAGQEVDAARRMAVRPVEAGEADHAPPQGEDAVRGPVGGQGHAVRGQHDVGPFGRRRELPQAAGGERDGRRGRSAAGRGRRGRARAAGAGTRRRGRAPPDRSAPRRRGPPRRAARRPPRSRRAGSAPASPARPPPPPRRRRRSSRR